VLSRTGFTPIDAKVIVGQRWTSKKSPLLGGHLGRRFPVLTLAGTWLIRQQQVGRVFLMAEPRWLDEREAHLWRSWLRLNQELSSVLEEQISREGGLSGADYAVLVPLSAAPDGMLRARELGREILWDRSRLSHQLRRMETRGLLVREECAEDARGAVVRMTDTGRAAIRRAAPGHVAATRQNFFDLLSNKELDQLTTLFDRVLANLDRDDGSNQEHGSEGRAGRKPTR
jgi:DNA-binding MarR family transcriptional regulator